MRPLDDLAVYDHVRPADDAPVEAGVYRVVGTSDEGVALLRVTDADGRRRHTGEVVTVERDARAGFEAAENPDENRSLAAAVRSQVQGLWWTLRLVGGTVVERPLAGGTALALVTAGLAADRVHPMPDLVEAVLILVGGFSLLYLSRSGDPAD